MENEIVIKNFSVQNVIDQMRTVKELYKSVMIKDEHFGIIPGTKKETLYKAGAEKLITMFSLVPKIEEKKEKDLRGGHREIEIILGLYNRKTQNLWGQGVGSCSTLESKYRYKSKMTEKGNVPKTYWDDRNNSEFQGFIPKKVDGVWKFFIKGEKEENPDIADVYNTVLKMAYKRALVSACITATGVSDIFTQDIEDFQENSELNQKMEVDKPDKTSQGTGGLSEADKIEGNYVALEKTIKSIDNLLSLNKLKHNIRERKWTPNEEMKIEALIQEKSDVINLKLQEG